ncbi:MAG: beta-galactosidase, partial [Clostridia bacterium]|nr:beta-galactosidase [Clostridia bacterium]
MEIIGKLKTYRSDELKKTRIGIGFECVDRDLIKPEKCYDLFAETGAKLARCQTGWAKTERVKGVYDFAWLDDIVDN